MRKRDLIGVVAVAAAVVAGGNAKAQTVDAAPLTTDKDVSGVQVSDPFEGANRGLYKVHDAIDRAVLVPIALGYRAVIPSPGRKGVRNVLRNVASPVVFLNDVLQGSPKKAGVTVARFGINTTLGVAGIFDVARRFGLEHRAEDFGQTLGVWGVGEGPFLFIPVLGPTNARDLVGRFVDIGMDPLTYAKYDGDTAVRISRVVLTGLDAREQLIEPIRDIRAQSPDPYASIKRIYTANRRNDIKDGAVDVEALPDFDDTSGIEGPPVTAPETPPQEPAAPAEVPAAGSATAPQ